VLSRGGHPVIGFGLASASTFAQAETDLQNQVIAVIAAGDVYYRENVANFYLDFSDATLAYQAAGQAGATSIGPEIDAVGVALTPPIVQQALTLNDSLQALPKTGLPDSENKLAAYHNQADADKAKTLVSQMVALYNQAISEGSAALRQPVSTNVPQPSPSPTPVPTPPSVWPVLALGAVVAAVAVVAVNRSGTKRRKHGYA